MLRPLVLLALYLFAVPAGSREGRAGNERLREGDFEGAAALYRAGLARSDSDGATDDAALAVRAALLNNLGLALYEDGLPADALRAFEAAADAAPDADGRARAAFNAGAAAARLQDLEGALGFYRRALLARPAFPEAAFNYEFVRRRLQQQNPQDEPPPDVEPSAFAQRLKAQADALVARRRYADALALMEDGARADSTVAAYRDFLGRLGTVVDIEDVE